MHECYLRGNLPWMFFIISHFCLLTSAALPSITCWHGSTSSICEMQFVSLPTSQLLPKAATFESYIKKTTCYLKPPILSLQKHWLRISISWSFNSKWDKLIQIMYIEHGVKCVISVANLFKLKQMFWIICLLAYFILFHISPDHRTW